MTLHFDTGKLRSVANTLPLASLSQLQQDIQHLKHDPSLQIRRSVQLSELTRSLTQIQTKLTRLKIYLQDSANRYEQVEQRLRSQANDIPKPSIWKSEYAVGTHRTHTSITKDKSLVSYLKNGVCAGFYAGFDAWKASAGVQKEIVQGKVGATIGNAKISGDVRAALFENGKWDPSLTINGLASAAVGIIKGNVTIGNAYVHADGEATVGIGVVKAEGKAVLNKEELTLKGEVGAAAVQGEVKGSFTLFGVTVTATGTGELGSVGAGAEFSSKKGEFSVGAKGSLLAGLGFHIKVNY